MQIFAWYYPSTSDLAEAVVVRATLDRLAQLRASGLYLMPVEAEALAAPESLRTFIERCQEQGVQVHLGLVPFSAPPQMTVEMERRQYRWGTNGQGKHHGMCPAWPENRILALDRARRLLELFEPDGLHLDYARYYFANSDVFGVNLEWEEGTKWIDTYHRCQCGLCQTERLELLGREATWWDEHHPAFIFQILHRRDENMRTFIKQARGLCAQSQQVLSVACRVQYMNRALIEGQDWVGWARRGLVDVISPMNYSPCPEVVQQRLRENRRLLGAAAVTHLEGLGRKSSAGEPTLEAFVRQVEIVGEAGLPGIAIFQLAHLTDRDLDSLAEFA